MLFRRRKELGRWARFRRWVWPSVSWRRSFLYFLKRTLRLSGTPYAIAMGTAIGAFASFTPFIGLHLIITMALAWMLGANMIAGAIGTAIGNPLTFPVIWASTYEIGQALLGERRGDAPAGLGHELMHKSFDQILPLLKPMLVGSAPLGLIVGTLVYIIVHKAVSAYQEARRRRFEAGRVAESGQKP